VIDDGQPRLQVEATGETVGEAKWQALRELERLSPELDKSRVQFQVVSEGERGLLGVGYTPAHVIATLDEGASAEPVDESEEAASARGFVRQVVDALGVRCRIDVEEGRDSLIVSCSGSELGLLFGKHGRTIDAIQYLANAVAFRSDGPSRKPIVVDAAGYRARREATLGGLAVRQAEHALATGEPVELEPMAPAERKIVHLRLKDYPGIETASHGTEPNRHVVISPTAHSRGGNEVSPTDPLLSD